MAKISCNSLYPAPRSPRVRRAPRLTRRAAAPLLAVVLVAGLGCREDSGAPSAPEPAPGLSTAPLAGPGLFPELQTVVPHDVQLVRSGGRETIRFTNAIANTGRGPFHIVPRFPRPGSGGTQDAIQQILDANGRVVQQRLVSQYQYHPGHGHWHIANVALYLIRSGSLTGPIFGRTRQKTTFCLIDVIQLAGFPNTPRRYSSCNTGAQGISVGWGDEYGWYLADQDLDITGAPPGIYYLISSVNAQRRFIETTYTNNRAWVGFRLRRDAAGRATIRLLNHSPCAGSLCGSPTGVIRRFARPAQ
jgi:lysyl oxidase